MANFKLGDLDYNNLIKKLNRINKEIILLIIELNKKNKKIKQINSLLPNIKVKKIYKKDNKDI